MSGIGDAVALLRQISDDKTVPKNIRESAIKAKDLLEDKTKEVNIRIDSVREILDSLGNDPNISVYTRTQIWNVITFLERA